MSWQRWSSSCSRFVWATVCVVIALVAKWGHAVENDTGSGQQSVAKRIVRKELLLGIEGNTTNRNRALRRALCEDPNCQLAHWYLGELRKDNQWLTIEEVERRMAHDPQLQEYRRRREAVLAGRQRELALAGWCRRHEMADAERLHLYQVVRGNSADAADRKKAMDRLGLRSYGGTLLSQAEIEQIQQQVKKDQKDFEKWSPRIEKWRTAIESKSARRRGYALEQIRAVTDVSAVRTLEQLLSLHSESLALEMVSVLGIIPDHEATTSLVRHSIDSPWASVRDAAVELLKRRPLHDFAPQVLRELETPVKSEFYVSIGSDGLVRHKHQLYREGALENHRFTASYTGGPQRVRTNHLSIHGARQPGERGEAARQAVVREMQDRVHKLRVAAVVRHLFALREAERAIHMEREVAKTNEAVSRKNERVFAILERTTGEVVQPSSPVAWWEWWQDYNEVYREEKPTYTHRAGYLDPYYVPWTSVTMLSCFPAGTQVRIQTGLLNIDDVQVGDRVLSQDVETGELAYKLVLQTTERPPSDLLRISLANTTITTTKGHPFWVNNVGWRMAKRLKVGDQFHTTNGGLNVGGVQAVPPEKAFNLVVADFGTYFVGERGLLVHDNTYRKPTTAIAPGLLEQHAETGP